MKSEAAMSAETAMAADADLILARQTDCLLSAARRGGPVFIFPHVRADGDAIGACMAYAMILAQIGLSAVILAEEALPEKFAFLPAAGCACYRAADPAGGADGMPAGGADGVPAGGAEDMPAGAGMPGLLPPGALAVAIDSHGFDRLGRREALFEGAPCRLILDHHPSDRPPDPLYFKDTAAAASCEIVCRWMVQLERRLNRPLLNRDIATCLMTGLLTDTGRFSYTNTTAVTLETGARLLAAGADIRDLTARLFDTMRPARLALMGRMAVRARYYCGGRLLISGLTASDLADCGAVEEDLDGLAGQLRDVEGVDVALLLRETADGAVRGNLRASERFDVSAYARTLGGGGHRAASGFTLTQTDLARAWERCAAEIADRLSRTKEEGTA